MSVNKSSGLGPSQFSFPVQRKPAPKPKTIEKAPPVAVQKESFTSTALSPESVAQVEPNSHVETKPEVEQKELPKPRKGSSMALMLENIEAAELAGGELKSNANGTLAILEEPPSSTLIDEHHGHGHHKSHDGELGGHLATEVVEKVGHNAHHVADHGASHGAELAHAAEHVSEHGSDLAHGVTGHAAEGVHEAAGHGVEAASHASDASEVSELVEGGAEAAHHLSTGLSTALGVSAVASVGIGGVMLYHGGKELKDGLKEKDGEKIAEGVGGLAVGARSVAAAPVMAAMVSSAPALAEVASVASKFLTPLGVIHGGIDIGLGVKDLAEGKVTDGLLKVGLGGSIAAGALVGGLPLTFLALGFLGAKVGRTVVQGRKAKKAAKALEAQQAPAPTPSPELKDSKT